MPDTDIIDTKTKHNKSNDETLGVIISTLAALLLLAFIIIVIIIWRQKRKKLAGSHQVIIDKNNFFGIQNGTLKSDTKFTNGKMYNVNPYSDLDIKKVNSYGTLPKKNMEGRELPDVPYGTLSSTGIMPMISLIYLPCRNPEFNVLVTR